MLTINTCKWVIDNFLKFFGITHALHVLVGKKGTLCPQTALAILAVLHERRKETFLRFPFEIQLKIRTVFIYKKYFTIFLNENCSYF